MRIKRTLFVAEFLPFPQPKIFKLANETTHLPFQKGVDTPFVAAFTSHTPIFCNEIQIDPFVSSFALFVLSRPDSSCLPHAYTPHLCFICAYLWLKIQSIL
jgi:hypothetical protein